MVRNEGRSERSHLKNPPQPPHRPSLHLLLIPTCLPPQLHQLVLQLSPTPLPLHDQLFASLVDPLLLLAVQPSLEEPDGRRVVPVDDERLEESEGPGSEGGEVVFSRGFEEGEEAGEELGSVGEEKLARRGEEKGEESQRGL